MQALAPLRSQEPGLSDLMNYAALVDEGIVQGKDGSLMAGFFFRGDDAGSASNADRDHITALVNTYLARFGSGWVVYVDAVRFPSPGYPAADRSHFPDAISRLIDEERREMFERQDAHYESEYAMVLQYLPPLQRESKLKEMFYNDDGRVKDGMGSRLLAEFKKRVKDFQDGLGDPLHMHRMGTAMAGDSEDRFITDELVNYLHFCVTGEMMAIRIPDCPMYLDSWMGIPDMWPGALPKVGDKFVCCVAIEGFPSHSRPGVLSVFENLAVSYRWSSRFIFLDQRESLAELDKYHRTWKQKIRGFRQQLFRTNDGVTNLDAAEMTEEVKQSVKNAQSDLVAFGYYTTVVVLMSENRPLLEDQAAYVKKEIERKGFATRIEEVNTVEAWRGTLPGHPHQNVRRPLMHTLNLADVLPLAGIWPGLPENPCEFYPAGSPPLMYTVTTGSTPFWLNLHVRDVAHTFIAGPIGSGKSTLLSAIAAQGMRYESKPRPDGSTVPATITAFDKGRSLYTLCSATGGTHYDIGSDDPNAPALCPLADIDNPSDLLWALEWVGTCFRLQKGRALEPNEKNEVTRALTRLQAAPKGRRSMTYFVNGVQEGKVKAALKHYTLDGATGRLLDGMDDDLNVSNFTVFEIDELMSMGEQNAIPVLLYLFRRFEKTLTGQPAFLLLDEAWVMLGHEVFRDKLRQWLKELRKQNCAVVLATQSLSDADNSGIIDVLLEQCSTKIFLPNREAELHGPAEFYRRFGLNEREIALIKSAQPKKHYYYTSELGRRLFELGLGPIAMSFVAVSDKDSIRDVKALQEKHGAEWPLYWMKKRGVDYEKYKRS
jgi:type IV secretion system protein VirB4